MPEASVLEKIPNIPTTPGIYIYKDTGGKVLYVGKAKNLKNRVRSYFTKSADLGPAKDKMVQLIADIETIATDTELEALVLEANLIRKHQPPYNVLLRDDKYYLFIKITKEDPPRIFPIRKIIKDGARYFGPYSSAASVRATLRLLRRIFPFKGEKETPHDIVFPHPLFSTSDTHHSTESIIKFLKGNRQQIIQTLEAGIQEYSKNLEFERAALFRDQLQAIMRLEGFQKVYLPRKESFDVISIAQDATQSAGTVLQIREGKLLGKQTLLLKHRADALMTDILRQFILQYYSVAQDVPKEILLPLQLEDTTTLEAWLQKLSHSAQLLVPKRGVRRQLMDMGELNATHFLREQGAVQETARASKEALVALLEAIGVGTRSSLALQQDQGKQFRIETYDISNIQGTLATASMIVFSDGMPAKDQYRKFKIKYIGTAENQQNDFAMLEETLTRRLARTDWSTPDLIVIDG